MLRTAVRERWLPSTLQIPKDPKPRVPEATIKSFQFSGSTSGATCAGCLQLMRSCSKSVSVVRTALKTCNAHPRVTDTGAYKLGLHYGELGRSGQTSIQTQVWGSAGLVSYP